MCPGYQFKYSHDRATPSFSSAKTGANKNIYSNSSLNEKIKKSNNNSNSNSNNLNNSKSKASSSTEIRGWLVSVEQGAVQLRTRCPAPPRLGCTPLDTSSMAQQGVTYTGEVGTLLYIGVN